MDEVQAVTQGAADARELRRAADQLRVEANGELRPRTEAMIAWLNSEAEAALRGEGNTYASVFARIVTRWGTLS